MQPKKLLSTANTWQKDVLFLVVFLTALYFILLGVRPLFVPDEGRYAEIAREMVVSNNYLTPHLNFIKYFEKPPLFYWLGALAIKTFGTTLWGLRSINAFFSIAGCLVTYLAGKRLFNREIGFYAALILGTSTLYFGMGHIINLDMALCFFLTASLYCFLLATETTLQYEKKYFIWFCAFFAALACLTKGLIGIVFPGLIILSWFLITNQWRLLQQLYFFSSVFIFIVVFAPWHILVGLKNPEFFYFYFIEQHFLRFATTDIGHYRPYWYFIPCLAIGFFPWIIFMPQTFYYHLKQKNRNPRTLFLCLWSILIFLFFSFSKSKLMSYILPTLPPLSMLTAYYIKHDFLEKQINKANLIALGLFIFFSICIAIVFIKFSFTSYLPHPHHAKRYLVLAASVLVAGSIIAYTLMYVNKRYTILTIIVSAFCFLMFCIASLPSIDTRTIQPFAQKIKSLLKPEDEVVAFGQYYQDLPFYIEKKTTVVGWLNELSFGVLNQDDASDWMIDSTTFWHRWSSDKRLYVLMSNDSYAEIAKMYWNIPFFVLAKNQSNILITNHPMPNQG